jgi:hypothetical protein
MARKQYITVHGRKATSPFGIAVEDGGCRPTCTTCDTGMVCARDTDDHYCASHECPTNDRARFIAEYPR